MCNFHTKGDVLLGQIRMLSDRTGHKKEERRNEIVLRSTFVDLTADY